MKNEKLKKQIKNLSKSIPKHIDLVPEIKVRELTKDEIVIIKGYFDFYNVNGWEPVRGLHICHISKKSFLDIVLSASLNPLCSANFQKASGL